MWFFKKKKKHIWKEIKQENLGSFFYMGHSIDDMGTRYRIAVTEECLLTKEKRIREKIELFPIKT